MLKLPNLLLHLWQTVWVGSLNSKSHLHSVLPISDFKAVKINTYQTPEQRYGGGTVMVLANEEKSNMYFPSSLFLPALPLGHGWSWAIILDS